MVKIFKISQKALKNIPVQKKPVVQAFEYKHAEPQYRYPQQPYYMDFSILAGMKNVIKSIFGHKTQTANAVITSTASAESIREAHELDVNRSVYRIVCSEYKNIFGTSIEKSYAELQTCSLTEIKNLIATIREKIAHEKMMRELEKTFAHGADHYMPKNKRIPTPAELLEVVPNENNPYKDELQRLCKTYIANSIKIDDSLFYFKDVMHSFSEESAKSIKEIFDLQSDTTLKILERIPKLGIIPKALRVTDQIRLANCVLKDYNDVTDAVLTNGLNKLLREYREQYNTIKNFVEKNKEQAKLFPEFTETYLCKITDAKNKRFVTDEKMLNSFASTGMNISNICKSTKKKGLIDIARKTAVTMFSLF